jgi:hypothetical protein
MLFALEPLIVARINAARLADANGVQVAVLTGEDVAELREEAQPAPCVHVLYEGFRPVGEQVGAAVSVEESWSTWAVVRNVSQRQGAAARRAAAAPILDGLVRVLLDWKPTPEEGIPRIGTLQLRPGGRVMFGEGYSYFPLLWSTRFALRGAPS